MLCLGNRPANVIQTSNVITLCFDCGATLAAVLVGQNHVLVVRLYIVVTLPVWVVCSLL